jgi:hypothetical protein
MNVMLQVLSEKEEEELLNYLVFKEKLILLAQHWEKQWEELQEVS